MHLASKNKSTLDLIWLYKVNNPSGQAVFHILM